MAQSMAAFAASLSEREPEQVAARIAAGLHLFSAEEFRQLLDALPAAIYTTDAEGRITYYNEAAVALAGRRPRLGVDEWCVTWRLRRPDGSPLAHPECPMAVALKEERPVRGVEALAERLDGTLVPFLPFPTPLFDAEGALVGAVNMLVDISERKAAEAQTLVLLKELNHRVKNNMQMMVALLRGAQRDTENPEARAVLADASRRIGAMAAAQQVLYAADAPVTFDARSFVETVCSSTAQVLGGRLTVECTVEVGKLANDTAMPLALILNELLTNAAKYAADADGQARVAVSLRREGEGFELRVRDHGPGFSLSTVRRRSSGLGLVVGLARQLGGALEVEIEHGACCVVRFCERGIPGQ